MSKNRPRRNIERFDYKIYDESGIKIGNGRKCILVMERYEELHITLRQELGGPSYEESYP